jgi:MoaA/NifB/PqqE/SkfB family radical SAM enzyme|tara:strand:+ start:472 stop:1605 length:1134 start_codon:yes stop_codon:yes gene_type:complete
MKPLLSQCYIGYRFGKINTNKDYYICCGTPSIGNYEDDGSFKKFWSSKKYNNLRKKLKYDIEKQNKEWNNDCLECPHYAIESMVLENLENQKNSVYGILTEDRIDGMMKDYPKTGPREFQFEIGNSCNHRCNFCWNWSHDLLENMDFHPLGDGFKEWAKIQLDLETYISIIDDLDELGGCEEISISGGGDPFIVPNIMKMLEHTKKLDFKLKVFTNFSRIGFKDIDNFIEWGVDQFDINISAGTEETYCKSRKLKSKDWNLLLDNLEYMKERKEKLDKRLPRFKYVVVVTRENIEEVDEIFDLAIKHGSYFIDFRNMMGEVYNKKYLSPTEKQLGDFNKKFFKNIEKYGFEEVKGEYYFYSEKLKLGVYNESFSSWG